MQGLYLVPPNGPLIVKGRKRAIVKAHPLPQIAGRELVLVSGSKAYGTITLDAPEEVPLADFDERYADHLITPRQRMRWWPDAKALSVYPIAQFSPYAQPLPVVTPPGVQTFMDTVNFVAPPHTGVMLAFYPPTPADALDLALDPTAYPDLDVTAPEDLHLTVAFLGDISDLADRIGQIAAAVAPVARRYPPMPGIINGHVFNGEDDGSSVAWASVDIPLLPQYRTDLLAALSAVGVTPQANHGFTPHITLAYMPPGVPEPSIDVPSLPWTFGVLHLVAGERHMTFEHQGDPLAYNAIKSWQDVSRYLQAAGLDVTPELHQCQPGSEDRWIVTSGAKALSVTGAGAISVLDEEHARWEPVAHFLGPSGTPQEVPDVMATKATDQETPTAVQKMAPKGMHMGPGADGCRPGSSVHLQIGKDQRWFLKNQAGNTIADSDSRSALMDLAKGRKLDIVVPGGKGLAEDAKDTWDTAYKNDLPDEAFLFVETGGDKDDDNKTTPRSLRHLPYKDADGKIDLPHLRNAISRLGQPATGTDAVGMHKVELQAKAQQIMSKVLNEAASSKGLQVGPVYQGFKTLKGQDGRDWLLTWTTNSFEDREGEIFTTKALEDYVARHEAEGVKGRFWFWHVPGSDYGDIVAQGMVGRFMVEAGPFDAGRKGQAFKNFFAQHPDGHPDIAPDGWGCSQGYLYVPADRLDGVYDWFDKKETSVLPLHAAANPYTRMEVVPMALTESQKAAFKVIGGDELVRELEDAGMRRTKDLESKGVAYKGLDPMRSILEVADGEGLDPLTRGELVEISGLLDGSKAAAPAKAPPAPPDEKAAAIERLRGVAEKVGGAQGQRLTAAADALAGAPAPAAAPAAKAKPAANDNPFAKSKPAAGKDKAPAKDEGSAAEEAAEPADEEESPEEEAGETPEEEAAEPADTKEPPKKKAAKKAVDAELVTSMAGVLAEALQLGNLSDTLTALQASMKQVGAQVSSLEATMTDLQERVKAVETDDNTKLAEKSAAELPRFAWFRASQASETASRVKEVNRQSQHAGGINETPTAVKAIAAKIIGNG